MAWINKKAHQLLKGQRVRLLAGPKSVCVCMGHQASDGFVVVQPQRGKGRTWRLSPNYRVLIPLADDPALSGWKPEA